MRRLERLHAITNQLRARSPRPVSAATLAARFEVSTRTIERDLRSLQDSGVPIYAVAGRTGGYAILPDFALPPIRLTAQEAAACLAGLDALRRSPYAVHARTAADKILIALPEKVREERAATAPLTVPGAPLIPTGAWIDAISEHRVVELRYADDDAPRTVEPYTALEGGGRWYLIGWCRRSDGVRGFRVDRIRELRTLPDAFEPRRAADVARDLARWDARSSGEDWSLRRSDSASLAARTSGGDGLGR